MGNIDYQPSLIHGDLWSGNICADREGKPVILDPATYCVSIASSLICPLKFPPYSCFVLAFGFMPDGHSEAEFGMSWCANFTSTFYNAYFEVHACSLFVQSACPQARPDGLFVVILLLMLYSYAL